jgi:hypothetical protein
MTCFLITIEWLLNSALSAFTHRTRVIELSTTRSDLLARSNSTAGIRSYFGTSDLGELLRTNSITARQSRSMLKTM